MTYHLSCDYVVQQHCPGEDILFSLGAFHLFWGNTHRCGLLGYDTRGAMFPGSVNSVRCASRRGITHGREAHADRLLSLEVSYYSRTPRWRTHSRLGG